MSKYGELSRNNGHSKFFLQKTLTQHDRSMDDPWMQAIYNKSFSVEQYAAWLAMQHAAFEALERLAEPLGTSLPIMEVYDVGLLRKGPLETDLQQLLGKDWRTKAEEVVAGSSATQRYLKHIEADSEDPALLLAHHFLQYNAVLSGGSYLGKCVCEKLSVPIGAPGVAFYAFKGIQSTKHPARVQQYLARLDTLDFSEDTRGRMLTAMNVIYEDTEDMMKEVYQLDPVEGKSYKAATAEGAQQAPKAIPEEQQVELSLQELHRYNGVESERILMSIGGIILDITTGAEVYGAGGAYHLFAGHDVTKCLGTMSLDTSCLDDVSWVPENPEDLTALRSWMEKLMEKYPVAGKLKSGQLKLVFEHAPDAVATSGPQIGSILNPVPSSAEATSDPQKSSFEKCPISGLVASSGFSCPMASVLGKSEEKSLMGGSGKSLTAAYNGPVKKSSGTSWLSEDGVLHALCPLHWDMKTCKLLCFFGAMSWCSGAISGWVLHRALRS